MSYTAYDVADFAASEPVDNRDHFGCEDADVFDDVLCSRGHDSDPISLSDAATFDADEHYNASVDVKIAVEDQRTERRECGFLRGWNPFDNALEHFVDAEALTASMLTKRKSVYGYITTGKKALEIPFLSSRAKN